MTNEITRLQARVKVLEDALRVARAHVANNAQGWPVELAASRDDLAIVDAALAASIPADPVANASCCQAKSIEPAPVTLADALQVPEVQALVETARDARLQIAYIDERSPSGTSQSTLARLSAALRAIEEGEANDQN